MIAKYYSVGETFELNGKKYIVEECDPKEVTCAPCAFWDPKSTNLCSCPPKGPMCIKHFRKDNKSVLFKEVKDEKNAE